MPRSIEFNTLALPLTVENGQARDGVRALDGRSSEQVLQHILSEQGYVVIGQDCERALEEVVSQVLFVPGYGETTRITFKVVGASCDAEARHQGIRFLGSRFRDRLFWIEEWPFYYRAIAE